MDNWASKTTANTGFYPMKRLHVDVCYTNNLILSSSITFPLLRDSSSLEY